MIYLLIYIAAIVTALYIIELHKAVQNRKEKRQKNIELRREREQEMVIHGQRIANLVDLVDPSIQLHQYKTYVIRSVNIDVGYGCNIFSNDMKTKIGNTLEILGTREEAVKSAEEWIDDWLTNRERNV